MARCIRSTRDIAEQLDPQNWIEDILQHDAD
jgi:hypothetical protein